MAKTEAVVRFILGPIGMDVRPLAYAADIAIDLIFYQRMSMDDIQVTNDIYPEVAKLLKNHYGKVPTSGTVSKRIQRLANLYWETLVDRDLVLEYVGAPIKDIRAPRDIIFYIAFYAHLDTPYFIAIRQEPSLLF